VDPGQKKIGLAVSDPTRTIASPLTVLRHVSMAVDAARTRKQQKRIMLRSSWLGRLWEARVMQLHHRGMPKNWQR